MNIQNEVAEIHHQYGISEVANYKIQLLCEKFAKLDKEAIGYIPIDAPYPWNNRVTDEIPKTNKPLLCYDLFTDDYYLCWFRNGRFKLTTRAPLASSGNCDGNMFREDVTECITHWRYLDAPTY